MKSSPQRHSPSNATPHRVHISSVIAQKLSQIGDNTVFDSDNHISVREWRGESRLQRYIVNDSGPESFLVPVGMDHEGQTFVIHGKGVPGSVAVRTKTRRTISNILPLLGIISLLSLDTYLAHRYFQKGKEAESGQAPVPKLQDTAPKIFTVSEILDKYDITLDDFILNNSWLPLANAGALPSVLQQKLTLSPQVTTTTARVSEIGNPLTHLLGADKKLEDLLSDPLLQKSMDQYYTMLESMISFECAQKGGDIPKDTIGGADVHGGDQYAGINMNAAKNSGNTEKLQHAQEIAACYEQGDQKKLRKLVKAYYLLYYFPSIQSKNPAISAFLLDTSMNRGSNALQPICKMVINSMTHRDYNTSQKIEETTDKEGKPFERHTWDTEWTQEHQKIWDIVCQRFPYQVMQHLRDARRVYEDGTYGSRVSIRTALENRWNRAQTSAEEMLLPATYRTIGYHESVAMIEKSLTEKVPTHDSVGKPIIYRVQRIQNPTQEQMKFEEVYKHTLALPRPKKEMVLFHGTASGIFGVADERTRDLGGFNAVYKSSAAAYVVTGKGLIFEFFDPTKGYGAANATRIAESTGIPKEEFNFNDACVGIELCLRGYEGGPFTETAAAKYGVEPPTDIQKKVSRTLGLYLKQRLNIQHLGTSADPVRDHTRCYDAQGRVLIGSEYLVPEAHCDDFSSQDRQEMGIMSAEQMAEIFRNRANLSALFELDVPAKVKLTNQ